MPKYIQHSEGGVNMNENIDNGFLVDTDIDDGFLVDPYITIYKVFALLDKNKCIIGIESTLKHTEQELTQLGYIEIDMGIGSHIYGHAQNNYLLSMYGKPMLDEKERNNYKYIDSVMELTEEEKEQFFPPIKPEPSEIEIIKKELEVTAQAVQDLILMTMGGE